MSNGEEVEQTLYICPEVHVFRIPPRPSAGGYRSGEWRLNDKIYSGRLRVTAIGRELSLKIEDVNSGELFAMVRTDPENRNISIERATDSSRYFILRVEDQNTKRHAFLGMGFDERGDSFDFNAALDDHERHLRQAEASKSKNFNSDPELAALHKSHGDLGLKEGETIRINIDKSKIKTSKLVSTSSKNFVPMIRPPPPGAIASDSVSKNLEGDQSEDRNSNTFKETTNWTTF